MHETKFIRNQTGERENTFLQKLFWIGIFFLKIGCYILNLFGLINAFEVQSDVPRRLFHEQIEKCDA